MRVSAEAPGIAPETMTYRTKRPRVRGLLTFGAGATLAIAQLGAGCVPLDASRRCTTPDAAVDDAGNCVSVDATPTDGGSDAK